MSSFNSTPNSLNAMALLAHQRNAFRMENSPTIHERLSRLGRLRKAVLSYRSELEQAVSEDFGHRSVHETGLLELTVIIQSIDYLSKNLDRFMGTDHRRVGFPYKAGRAYVKYQPLGVVGIMSPWNYPVSLSIVPLATALAAGNRAILKPSEITPKTSKVIQRMIVDAFPADLVSVVLGGPDVGAAFSRLPFDHLFFTGSTEVGRKVMNAASENLVPVTLELGGKSPVIVGKGEVNAKYVSSIAFGKLANGGQTCVAPDYALVHEDDLEKFVDLYTDAVGRLYPLGPSSNDYTSIVNERHYRRLGDLVADAKLRGATVREVGVEPETARSRLRTIAPTLVLGAGDDSAIMKEEIFGPILPVKTYSTIDQAIVYVNERPRPLALYYFGRDGYHRKRVLKNTLSGNVGINNAIMHVAQDDLPFGGVGSSGMGAYHGIEGFRTMSHAKGVYIQGGWNLASLVRAPFGKLANFALSMTLGFQRQTPKPHPEESL